MREPLFVGIDGGGSKLRITVTDADLRSLASIESSSANPSVIGHDKARPHIRHEVAHALRQARLQPRDIAAAAIGIAGASNLHSEDWLLETVEPALPDALIVPSSDLEIALVGSLGQRQGILLLAGTGSAVYGVAPGGQRLQIGGWGYLLGDEGSGYWIGSQFLRHIIARHDHGASSEDDALTRACMDALGLTGPRELIAWLYRSKEAPAPRIAGLAELVLKAPADCRWATICVESAAGQLTRQVDLMRSRLDYENASIAFAGGLLDNDNALSRRVTERLGLPRRPMARHSPVIGAALLATMAWRATGAT
ncbi:MAG: hypothetical protein OXG13_13250 [Gemmatimonadaceae bacterium]|nr:hypothetical protein [Gemmatimonadaceae bacterium]